MTGGVFVLLRLLIILSRRNCARTVGLVGSVAGFYMDVNIRVMQALLPGELVLVWSVTGQPRTWFDCTGVNGYQTVRSSLLV